MKRTYSIIILVVATLSIAFASSCLSNDSQLNLEILQKESLYTPSGDGMRLTLKNIGISSVHLNPYCTVYWTNMSGFETNAFYKHDLGERILNPREVASIYIPHPKDAKYWDFSISYRPCQSKVHVFLSKIPILFSLIPKDNDAFIGQISPMITNHMSIPDTR